jgi:hypothetical protein
MMPIAEILFHVGASSLVLVGVAHTAGELIGPPAERSSPEATQLAAALHVMRETEVSMPGRKIPLIDMMRGFSLMMGALLIALGALDHALAESALQSTVAMGINVAISIFGLAISIRYFFILPTVLLSVSAIAFAASWLV